jgi:hypothetical protein
MYSTLTTEIINRVADAGRNSNGGSMKTLDFDQVAFGLLAIALLIYALLQYAGLI